LSHINFTRIKQHCHTHNAAAMVVVSVGFQPAVIRDAEPEGAGLLTADTLCQLLTLHQRLPLPLLNLAHVFAAKGLISLERFPQLTDVEARLQQWWRRVNLVLANLDYKWRSLPEIKGMLEVICQQQRTTPYSTEELAGILRWLSSWPVQAIEECNDEYRALYSPHDAWQRVIALFRIAEEAVPEPQGLAH
jgi:hypothetical protein